MPKDSEKIKLEEPLSGYEFVGGTLDGHAKLTDEPGFQGSLNRPHSFIDEENNDIYVLDKVNGKEVMMFKGNYSNEVLDEMILQAEKDNKHRSNMDDNDL